MVESNPLADIEYQTVTIKDVVYRRLKDAIITGRLRPGERLKEDALSKLLNVSRTPLREAVQRLEQEQLVERLPQGGVAVSSISVEDALELNEIRAQLEALAANIAAGRVKDGELNEAEQALVPRLVSLAETRSALGVRGNETPELDADTGREFHALIYAIAGRARLASMLTQVVDGLKRYRVRIPEERKRTVAEEHRAIANAIANGQRREAERYMRKHVLGASVEYKKLGQRD